MMESESKSSKILSLIIDVAVAVDLVSVVIAAVLLVRYLTQSPPPDVTELVAGILGILVLIAINGLLDRFRRLRRIEALVEQTQSLVESRIVQRVRAEEVLRDDIGPTETFFSTAMSIAISGITLGNTTREFTYILGQRLVAGADIRIILVDTSPEVLNQIVRRSFGTTTPDYYKARLESTSDLVKIIGNTPNATGTLAVGYLPFVPSFGIMMIDPSMPNGAAFVEIYHHNSATPSPAFELTTNKDPYWFRFFQEVRTNVEPVQNKGSPCSGEGFI